MNLISGGVRAREWRHLQKLSAFIVILLTTSVSSTDWRGISNTELQRRSLKLGTNQPNFVQQSSTSWGTKAGNDDDLKQEESINHPGHIRLGAGVEEDSPLKRGISKSFKPPYDGPARDVPATTRSPYVLKVIYENDNKYGGFLDLRSAEIQAKEKALTTEPVPQTLNGEAASQVSSLSSSTLSSDPKPSVHQLESVGFFSISPTVPVYPQNSSNVVVANSPTFYEKITTHTNLPETTYHPHIPYQIENSKTNDNFKPSNIDMFRQSIQATTETIFTTSAPQNNEGLPTGIHKKIATKISPLASIAADASTTTAEGLPFLVSDANAIKGGVKVINLGRLDTNADPKSKAILEQMKNFFGSRFQENVNRPASVLIFQNNKESLHQGHQLTSQNHPTGGKFDIGRLSNLQLPSLHDLFNSSQAPIDSFKFTGTNDPSSALAESVGNSLYVSSANPSFIGMKINHVSSTDNSQVSQASGKDISEASVKDTSQASGKAISLTSGKDIGLANSKDITHANGKDLSQFNLASGISDISRVNTGKSGTINGIGIMGSPVHAKYLNKLIPVTAFIDSNAAPLPGVHFVLNPWVYKFPPWFEPHNPTPPGYVSNSTNELPGDIILDLEDLQAPSDDGQLVNVRVPSFTQFKDEVIKTILESKFRNENRKGKAVEHNDNGQMNNNMLKDETASGTHPGKVVSGVRDIELDVDIAEIEHSIDHDLGSDDDLYTNSAEIDSGRQYTSSGSSRPSDGVTNHFGNPPSHGFDHQQSVGGSDAFHDDEGHHGVHGSGPSKKYHETHSFDGSKVPPPHDDIRTYKPSLTNNDYTSSKPPDIQEFEEPDEGSDENIFNKNLESDHHFHDGKDEFNTDADRPFGHDDIELYNDGYSPSPVYGTPHFHFPNSHSGAFSGQISNSAGSEFSSEDVSDYNHSGEINLSSGITNSGNEISGVPSFPTRPEHTQAAGLGHAAYDPSDASSNFGSDTTNDQAGKLKSSAGDYSFDNVHGGYPYGVHDSESDIGSDSHGSNFESGVIGTNYDSSAPNDFDHHNQDESETELDTHNHFGPDGSVGHHQLSSLDHYSSSDGNAYQNDRPHHYSEVQSGHGGNPGHSTGKIIFRDNAEVNYGNRPDHEGGQLRPFSGHSAPNYKPFRPSPPDPTSIADTSSLQRPLQYQHIRSKVPKQYFQQPHGYAYGDKYSSVFVSKPKYLKSLYGPPSKQKYNRNHGNKPFRPHPILGMNYILTPHKYYYDSHRSTPIMSSGQAVTYWVPSKQNFYRSSSTKRHDLEDSGSRLSEKNLVVGLHPAIQEIVNPSSRLAPPAKNAAGRNFGTPRLSEGLDLLPYLNSLHASRRRKDKLNISVPVSYTNNPLRNVSVTPSEPSNHDLLEQSNSVKRNTKKHSIENGIRVDIIYGSRKPIPALYKDLSSEIPIPPHLLNSKYPHVVVKNSKISNGTESFPRPLLLASSAILGRLKQRVTELRKYSPSQTSQWHWPGEAQTHK
ncbi:uncharacterized protein LOC108674164 [Hyalella azteca]|uniref:Uncharacterized protein LOC108674164 n=1 Tax=Hyalella azteca TaxID=294128 RepID=A0A8B7NXF8_HYAAZ|nr:uncharacterized protein LOC108674164 [Hyalella azteca]